MVKNSQAPFSTFTHVASASAPITYLEIAGNTQTMLTTDSLAAFTLLISIKKDSGSATDISVYAVPVYQPTPVEFPDGTPELLGTITAGNIDVVLKTFKFSSDVITTGSVYGYKYYITNVSGTMTLSGYTRLITIPLS